MNTTHKAAPYARKADIDRAHELGFYFTDYPLSYYMRLEIAEQLGEALTSGDYGTEINEIIHGVVDSAMPAYHNEILDEWQEAGCPESDDFDFGNGIWSQMIAGLYGAMHDFASSLLYTDSDDLEEALERLNIIFPYTTN